MPEAPYNIMEKDILLYILYIIYYIVKSIYSIWQHYCVIKIMFHIYSSMDTFYFDSFGCLYKH